MEATESPIPGHLLSRLSPIQRERLYKKPHVVALIQNVYAFCQSDDRLAKLYAPKTVIRKREKPGVRNGRINEAQVFKIQEEIAKDLEAHLQPEELAMRLTSSESAALLSAQHNHPLHPKSFNKISLKAGDKIYAEPLMPVEDINRVHLYLVRDVIHKRVRRESKKTEAAK